MIETEMAQSIPTLRSSLLTKIIRYWLPVAAMLAVMYYFSTDVFSGDNTRSLVENIVLWLWPGTTDKAMLRINYIVRKSAHFIEYAALAALLFRAFRADSPLRWRFRWGLYSFVTIVIWALLDEFHQSLTRHRGGSIKDSLLDSAGGLFALLVIACFNYQKNRRQRI